MGQPEEYGIKWPEQKYQDYAQENSIEEILGQIEGEKEDQEDKNCGCHIKPAAEIHDALLARKELKPF